MSNTKIFSVYLVSMYDMYYRIFAVYSLEQKDLYAFLLFWENDFYNRIKIYFTCTEQKGQYEFFLG